MPCHLSGNGRLASASSTHSLGRTDSSPRLVVMTSPVTPIQSPSESLVKASKSGVLAAGAKIWMWPLESCSCANANFP